MEIRYFKYCHYEYVAKISMSEARTCTLWARCVRTTWHNGYAQSCVYLGKFANGRIEPNMQMVENPCDYDYSIREGSRRMFARVADRFVAQVEQVYNRFMTERKKMGRPVNAKGLEATRQILSKLISRNESISDRQLAALVADKLGKRKIDPKSAWRWKMMVLGGVAKV